jgi:hypothetical protein
MEVAATHIRITPRPVWGFAVALRALREVDQFTTGSNSAIQANRSGWAAIGMTLTRTTHRPRLHMGEILFSGIAPTGIHRHTAFCFAYISIFWLLLSPARYIPPGICVQAWRYR